MIAATKRLAKMVAAGTAWPSRSRMLGAEMAKFAVVTRVAVTVQDELDHWECGLLR